MVKAIGSSLEREFDTYWRVFASNLPAPIEEHRFAKGRRWRFDRAFLPEKVAVELEGGVYANGRHTRASGFIGDCDKYNRAAIEGWLVLRFTTKHLTDNPLEVVAQVKQALASRKAVTSVKP